MPIDREPTKELAQALAELAELRRFSSAPKEFWPRLLVALASLAGASKANLLLKDHPASEQSPAKPTEGASTVPRPEVSRWKLIGDWPANAPPSRLTSLFAGRLEEFAD